MAASSPSGWRQATDELPGEPGPAGEVVRTVFVRTGEALARWTRLEVDGPGRLPPPPALVVANHGFGGIFDPNAFLLAALGHRLGLDRHGPLTILTHELAWTLGVGRLLEPAGLRKAGRKVAAEALAAGQYVIVLPGGDLDAGKPFRRRNEVVFGGRTGFASIAIDAGVPILPIVISGAGETALVLSDGQWLARRLRLDRLTRMKTMPISLSVPWGLSVGVAGILPYLPLPAKMRASVLAPMEPAPGERAQELAERVRRAMNDRLVELTRGRLPFLGVPFGAEPSGPAPE